MEADLALEVEDLGLNVLNFALIAELLLDVRLELVTEENVLVSEVEFGVLIQLTREGEVLVDLVTCLTESCSESLQVLCNSNHHISDFRCGFDHEVCVHSARLLLVQANSVGAFEFSF